MKFNKFDTQAHPVDIREWNCHEEQDGVTIRYEKCYVRSLTVMEYAELVQLSADRETNGRDLSLAKVAVRFALRDDKEGKRMFTPDDLEDIANNDVRPARRIMDKLWELNSMSKDEAETLEKN